MFVKDQDTAGEVDYFLGSRRRRQAQLTGAGEDPFLSKVSGDNREVGRLNTLASYIMEC